MKPDFSTRLKSVNVLTGLSAFGFLTIQFIFILMVFFGSIDTYTSFAEFDAADRILDERVNSICLALESGADPAILEQGLETANEENQFLIRVYDESQDSIVSVGDLDVETEKILSSPELRSRDDLAIDGWDRRIDASHKNQKGETYHIIVSGNYPEAGLTGEVDSSLLYKYWGPALVIGVGIAALNGFVSAGIVQLVLGKVRRTQREVNTISLGSLSRRVPTSGSADAIDQLAATMNNMLERLQKSNDQQTQFMADVSHELRSPITGMLSQLEVAEHYPENVDTKRMLPQLLSESRRAKNVVDDLMFLSRLEAEGNGKAPLSVEPVTIDALAQSEVATMQALHPNIELTLQAAQPTIIRAETNKYTRVLRNLLTNACRHASSKVAIEIQQDSGYMVLDITDDGDGIAEADRERIFDRFVRLDQARTRDAGGSGLGLSMTREIIRSYDGQVCALPPQHPDLRGAHFRVVAPLWVDCPPPRSPQN